MQQITQNYKTGDLRIEEVPNPMIKKGGAIVQTCYSLVSVGTERSTLEMSKRSILGKAKQRPDLVKQVIATAQKTGVKNTIDLVLSRLNTPVPLGYSLSGIVQQVSDDVTGISVGDLAACAGAGYANHAEIVFVPKNLIAKIPEGVSIKEATFTTLGSIALHSIRQANAGLGDKVGVIGLGLVGQLTVGLLKAHGCKILGIDLKQYTLNLSKQMGIDVALLRSEPNLIEAIRNFTDEIGLDAVIITAGTSSNDPFQLSSEVLRDKGTLVVVGGVRMEIVKSVSSLFYRKEADIKFSRSYGPGRYDSNYEEKGYDYPIGYVRWTENRNMRCFLELLASKQLRINPLITDVIPFEKAIEAYKLIQEKDNRPHLGILLEYSKAPKKSPCRITVRHATRPVSGKAGIGVIGAGKFAQSKILPYLKNHPDVALKGVCTSQGLTARNVAERFGFDYCSHDPSEIIDDLDIQVIFIATRHDSHAQYVVQALKKRKHVYVEKPLCITKDELKEVIEVYQAAAEGSGACLMVGYNRRFSQLGKRMKVLFKEAKTPLTIVYWINAGYIPRDNWYQDPSQGGRFLGEGGHFVDFGIFLTDSLPIRVNAFALPSDVQPSLNDNLVATMQMKNGSIMTIVYNASGAPSMSKERIEVIGDSSAAILDDFKSLALFRGNKKTRIRNRIQDKGHESEICSYIGSIKTGDQHLISFESLIATSLATFAIIESLKEKKPIEIESL